MPPVLLKVRFTVLPAPRSIVIAPAPRTDGTLNENAFDEPMCGCPSRLNRTRSIAFASVAVPTVERALAPIRSWSTMIAVVRPSSTSTSGRASVGMKPWTNVLYVSLMSRCNSAAMVPNTSELLPDPEMPVKTVSRRFGISTLTSLRLLTRAPCTRIRSWVPVVGGVVGCRVFLFGVVGAGAVGRFAARTLVETGVRDEGVIRFPRRRMELAGRGVASFVLNQTQHVPVGIGEGGHKAAVTDVVRGLLQRGTRGGHLGELRLDVGDVPVRSW